jgi:hypothetical protein
MEMFRCPTCLNPLADARVSRCPACNTRLSRRSKPIVLGEATRLSSRPTSYDRKMQAELEASLRAPAAMPLVAEYVDDPTPMEAAAPEPAPVPAPGPRYAVPSADAAPAPAVSAEPSEPAPFARVTGDLNEKFAELYEKVRAEVGITARQ